MPERRARAALVAAGLTGCVPAIAWPADAATSAMPDAIAACLLDSIARAAPEVTVGELRVRCARAATAARPAAPLALPADVKPDAAPTTPSPPAPRGLQAGAAPIASFGLLPHRPSYFMPLSYTDDLAPRTDATSPDVSTEIKFQLSFKLPFFGTDDVRRSSFFVGYTLQAWWQAYQLDRSNPFREYNHEPEFFYSIPTDRTPAGWRVSRVDAGFAHHSNGREDRASRSWNRLFVDLRAERGNWWTSIRPWWRIPEAVFKANSDSKEDNVDIGRYYGYAEWRLGYAAASGTSASTMLRWNPASGKGAVQVDLSTPTGFNPRIRWYLQGFAGYGESLANYDRVIHRASLGLMFSDAY